MDERIIGLAEGENTRGARTVITDQVRMSRNSTYVQYLSIDGRTVTWRVDVPVVDRSDDGPFVRVICSARKLPTSTSITAETDTRRLDTLAEQDGEARRVIEVKMQLGPLADDDDDEEEDNDTKLTADEIQQIDANWFECMLWKRRVSSESGCTFHCKDQFLLPSPLRGVVDLGTTSTGNHTTFKGTEDDDGGYYYCFPDPFPLQVRMAYRLVSNEDKEDRSRDEPPLLFNDDSAVAEPEPELDGESVLAPAADQASDSSIAPAKSHRSGLGRRLTSLTGSMLKGKKGRYEKLAG